MKGARRLSGAGVSAKVSHMDGNGNDIKPNDGMPDLANFLALEIKVWQALMTGDASADAALLTADFLGVYPSGFAGRGDHCGQLTDGPVMVRYQLDQARLRVIGRDHALLSYRATYCKTGGTGDEVMFISSLWERTKTGWLNSFSQDTPAA